MFFDDLESFGQRIALKSDDGQTLTYLELATLADDIGGTLGSEKHLVALEATNTVRSIATYLACLRARHPIALSDSADFGPDSRLSQAFEPDLLVFKDGRQWRRDTPAAATPLHPDLAVMLSTSGSTGSPKLVRLSQTAVDANAKSIATFLDIGPDDRAITSLPLAYSYGLSVINSHLARGATILLTEHTIVDDAFWQFAIAEGVTAIAGVPEAYKIFERRGFRENAPSTLRTLTQAGGRLSPDLVRTYSAWAAQSGVRFFVMYGQTEATARMAYLPPESAAENADCIGVPIPGGTFELKNADGGKIITSGVSGELVYRGPNIMMGYATSREDLALGQELDALQTGDIAEQTANGFWKIVGRASRFSKIGGKRISLDDLEHRVAEKAGDVIVCGDDEGLVIWSEADQPAEDLRQAAAEACGAPLAHIIAITGQPAPRLTSGKPNYRIMLSEGVAKRAAEAEAIRNASSSKIVAAYTLATGNSRVSPSSSFTGLGGDSLAYVQLSIELEKHIGDLPSGWESMPISKLEALAANRSTGGSKAIKFVPTDIVLRSLAIITVVLGHISNFPVKGGALILFLLSGYSLAKFQFGQITGDHPLSLVTNFIYRVIAPYFILMIVVNLLSSDANFSLSTLLLFGNIAGDQRGPLMPYWFLEALLQCLLALGLLFSLPPVRRLAKASPFHFSLALLVGALAIKYAVPLVWQAPVIAGGARSPDAWAYALVGGWVLYFAPKQGWKLAICALLAVVCLGDWGAESSRPVLFSGALLALAILPTIPLPNIVASLTSIIAAASFYIYLAHMLVIQILTYNLKIDHWPVTLAGAIIAGIAAQHAWQFVTPIGAKAFRRLGGGRNGDPNPPY